MSTNKTPNLALHSWVGTDLVKRTEFNENFDIVDSNIKNHSDRLNAIETANTSDDSRLDLLETDVSTAKTDITNLKSKDTAHDTALTDLDGRLDTAEATISQHSTDITNNASAITSQGQSIDSLSTNKAPINNPVFTGTPKVGANDMLTKGNTNPLAYKTKDTVPFMVVGASASGKIIRTTEGSYNNVLWDTIQYDNGFFTLDSTTGYITVPEDGLYEITARLSVTITNVSYVAMKIHDNGTYLRTLGSQNVQTANTGIHFDGTTRVKLLAGAKIGVRCSFASAGTPSTALSDTCVEIIKLSN